MRKIDRKQFLKQSGWGIAGLSFIDWLEPVEAAEQVAEWQRVRSYKPPEIAQDEQFWQTIRKQFSQDAQLINLNNGAVSPQPKPVQNALIENYRQANRQPSYYYQEKLEEQRDALRASLAEEVDSSPEEIAINRNATEGLNTIIFGLPLERGDEVVVSNYDYPYMLNAWRQRQKRDGVKLNPVTLQMPEEGEEAIVQKFANAITARTKVVHITHMINWTGQILPAKKITEMAHEKGCEVIVDAAHALGHFAHSFAAIGCDYYAASLHKWMCAPFGTGMLAVKNDKIAKLWPLLSSYDPKSDDIRKFEILGAKSMAAEVAIGNAVDFHRNIGMQRKEARLRYLKRYWLEQVQDVKGLTIFTSQNPDYSCGMATIAIDGQSPEALQQHLHSRQKVRTGRIDWEDVQGIRISPHIYNKTDELDRLVEGIRKISH
jgi:selenocysteine lyase/cysteine desulfurase